MDKLNSADVHVDLCSSESCIKEWEFSTLTTGKHLKALG